MRIFWDTFTDRRLKSDKGAFPTGTRVYTGFQGAGKTIGMVDYAFRLKKRYPDCLVFSNIKMTGIDYTYFHNNVELVNAMHANNGANGVLVLIDEAHLFFNRKDGISIDVLSAVSQQRKNRRRIVFSSQIWEELDISLRKQVKEIVSCRRFLGFFVQTIRNGETLEYDKMQGAYVAKKIRTQILRPAQFLGSRFDTLQEIVTNRRYVANSAPSAPATFIFEAARPGLTHPAQGRSRR